MFRIIKEDELKELLAAAHQFWAMQAGGVDNWEWAGESCCDYISEYNSTTGQNFEDFDEIAEFEVSGYADAEIEEGD